MLNEAHFFLHMCIRLLFLLLDKLMRFELLLKDVKMHKIAVIDRKTLPDDGKMDKIERCVQVERRKVQLKRRKVAKTAHREIEF